MPCAADCAPELTVPLTLSAAARPLRDWPDRLPPAFERGREAARDDVLRGLRDDPLRDEFRAGALRDDELREVRLAEEFAARCDPPRWVDVLVCAIRSSLLGNTS
jgi:hypothetical protein